MICKRIIGIVFIWLLLFPLYGQNITQSRSYMKSVPVTRESSLEVSNKYGNIYITPWNRDSAYVKAEVKAFAQNEAKLKKMFDGISIYLNDSKSGITAQTEFVQNISNFFEGFKGMTNKFISYESHVEVNYYISVPEYLNLRITNKYGDVSVENCTGDFSISVSNGSFKAGSLGKESSLTFIFCDATIKYIESGTIDASFSEVNLDESNRTTIKSISSRFEIKKAGEINFESRRDKFFIDEMASMKGNSYFTDFNIKKIKKDINIITRYGNLNAGLIENGFESVYLNSGYSDISFYFDESASFKLDIRHTNSFVVLPSENVEIEQETIDPDKKEYRITGTIGKNPGTSKVKIEATRGDIYLK